MERFSELELYLFLECFIRCMRFAAFIRHGGDLPVPGLGDRDAGSGPRHSRRPVILVRLDLVTATPRTQARHMDKLRTSPADAISDLPDGASIAVSGFGPSAGAPFSLLAALGERGTRDLCF